MSHPSLDDVLGLVLIRQLAFAALAVLCVATPAVAHPHIFIDAKAVIVFDSTGALAGVRHEWTFDEEFSAWSIQGLDTNKDGNISTEEMQELADQDMDGLGQYDYYTYAGEGDHDLKFSKGSGATLNYENQLTTLRFATALVPPYRIRSRLDIAINDPEYYVAVTFADAGAVTLENAPPGCAVSMDPPKEMDPALADQLYALGPDVVQLPPNLANAMRGVQGAIIITCPATGQPVATTALEAVNMIGNAKPIPFNGPPKEPGLPISRTGVLGWVFEMQKDFYAAMSDALGRIKADNNAFWLLGGLSFLYGILHAAGPGHGKVVISSYVLANEQQLRRGVLLSFISAMLQSTVAVVFVLVAAAALHMTSIAMSSAANWIGIGSYALVALLGVWLILRHLFFSHRHAPAELDSAGKAHAHLYGEHHAHHAHHDHAHHHHHDADDESHEGHDHVHVVTLDKIRGGWREQLAVVLGVGLRPCSGALVVLVFALSQDVVPAGIAAVFLMGLGTAITVAILATLASTAKGLALRLAGTGGGAFAGAAIWWVELAGAFGVLGFGLLLLLASL